MGAPNLPMNSPMGLRIRTNVAAMTTRGHLSRRTREVEESYAKLATGLRITRAGTDPAGLALSERLRVRTRSLAVAQRNIADGKGLLDVAEAAVQGIGEEVVRMRELAIRSASATLTADDRAIIQTEVDQRTEEINRMIDSIQFNDFLVLDGERVEIQIGIDSNEFVTFGLPNARVSSLQDVLATDLTTSAAASASLTNIDRAIRWAARESGNIGSQLNRLDVAGQAVRNLREGLLSAESRIRDVDYASETSKLTRADLLQQSAAAVLVQANAQPELSLQLLSGGL